MPALVRLYVTQVLLGFGIAAVFAAALVFFDIGGLRHLATTESGPLAIFLLWFFNGIVFAGVQFAIAVMNLKEDDRPGRGRRQPITRPVPVPARAKPARPEARQPRQMPRA